MSRTIDLSKSLYELSKETPEIIEIMRDLGFEDITKPGMLNTAGRIMTIPKGARMRKIDLDLVKARFESRGYKITD